MCRLLGYQGIAVVVEELLKVVSEQVYKLSHRLEKYWNMKVFLKVLEIKSALKIA